MSKEKAINIKLSEDLHAKLKAIAEKEEMPLTVLIRQALKEYVKKKGD
jgi:predicted transcriptional regulator